MLRLFNVILLSSYAFARITIDKIESCENTDYDVSFIHKIKEESGMQVVEEGGLITKVNMDDDIMGHVDVYAFEEGKWTFVITLQETFCQFISKYVPDIAKALEKAAGLTKSCPYPAGEYKVTDFPLDFEKIDYSLVPRGRLKMTATLSNAKTEKIMNCMNIELTVAD